MIAVPLQTTSPSCLVSSVSFRESSGSRRYSENGKYATMKWFKTGTEQEENSRTFFITCCVIDDEIQKRIETFQNSGYLAAALEKVIVFTE